MHTLKKLSDTGSPRAYAFFDVDDTLISIKSLLRFQEYWYEWTHDAAGRNTNIFHY